jgi:hypothetical protein
MFLIDWFLNDFPNAEGSISRGVEVFGLDVEGSFGLTPLIDLVHLH